MVPPPNKPAAPTGASRTSAAFSGNTPLARPSPFKALLLAPGKAGPAPSLAKAPVKAPPNATANPMAATAAPKGKVDVPNVPRVDTRDEDKPKRAAKPDVDALDPTARITAHLAPPTHAVACAAKNEEIATRARVSLEELVPQVVRRIAWGGDRVKGAVHLELLSGEKVTVHAAGNKVRVEVDGDADLERRLESRLRAAGIEVESVR